MSTLSQIFLMLPTVLACISRSSAAELEITYEWKYIDYNWKYETHKQDAIDSGKYNYTKILPIDFQKIAGDRVLITTPRYYDNPASLSTVSNKSGDGGPLLQPYPSWAWHESRNCSRIISVNRLFLDDCNRLWLVDSGKIENEQICPAKLLAFDPETDRLLKSIEIPLNISHNSVDPRKGRLEIQVVETSGESCEETWAYIGDPEGYGLVIWDGSHMWRLENDDVYAPDPTATTYAAVRKNVTLDIGVASFALTPSNFIDKPYLLFKPYSSFKDYAASLEDLHNSKFGNSVTYYQSNLTLSNQELARVFTKNGIIFGGLAGQPVLACWHLENPLASEYIATPVEDEETLQFISAVKIIERLVSEVQLMTNRLPDFISGTMNLTDINFRILTGDVTSLIDGTVCEPNSTSTDDTIEDKFFFGYERV